MSPKVGVIMGSDSDLPTMRAPCAYSTRRMGVRCALTMVVSQATPSSSSTVEAARMTGRSEALPMMTPTFALTPRLPGPTRRAR